ncbi:DUF4374 domain-containing protein [Fulvivirga sp. 29W222]|uniref:DUF4374 domain-containing protein n=1 Tax=Fulvivirga marina TaxID=2494733 RepID=A0A937FX77_9BACT|nr:DUF4374 domain-containing protein [Fulvivirga marina]MBL6447719.1 DUF4374 domain-containing protein [Fulvivirga marina]
MERLLKNTPILLAFVLILSLASCSDDDTVVKSVESGYVMSLRTQDADEESADYYITVNDLMTGEISAEGQGVELAGWNYNGHFADTYFAFGYDLNECIGYKIVNNQLVEQGKFVYERFDVMGAIDDQSFLAIGAPWGGGSYDCQIQVVDINEIAITKNVKHPIYESYDAEGTQLNAWPTGAYVDGEKLFVAFYPLNGSSWKTPNTDTAYISVYSYPEIEYIKTIKDARTAPIGYYGGSPSILEDESGNHYTLSVSSKAAGYTQTTKPSGILKINAGEDEFDADYFFNVEEVGYKVLSATYMGNGLAVARVISLQMDEAAGAQSQWAAFSEVTPLLNVAVLDLNKKTVTIVDDVPLHGGQYQTPYLIEGGKVYVSVNNGTEAHVYQVDPVTASATQGAKLIGNQFQALFTAK